MMAGFSGIEVEVFPAVETAETFDFVGDGMGVDYVHYDRDSAGVGLIDQGLELLGSAEAGAEREETAHLVSEGAVVGMLLEGHYLKYVVAQLMYPGQHLGTEVIEARDLLLFGAHADVAFVDEGIGALARFLMLPDIGLNVPDLGAENLGIRVLDHPCGIGGNPFGTASGPFYVEFVQIPVAEEHCRELYLPVAVPDRAEGPGLRPLPIVETAYQVDAGGVGRPLAENPAVGCLMKAVEEVIVYAVGQGGVSAFYEGYLFLETAVPLLDGTFEGLEPGVGLVYFLYFHFSSSKRSLAVRRYARQAAISSSERAISLSMSSNAVAGSSTLRAILSSSSSASL